MCLHDLQCVPDADHDGPHQTEIQRVDVVGVHGDFSAPKIEEVEDHVQVSEDYCFFAVCF